MQMNGDIKDAHDLVTFTVELLTSKIIGIVSWETDGVHLGRNCVGPNCVPMYVLVCTEVAQLAHLASVAAIGVWSAPTARRRSPYVAVHASLGVARM